MTDEKPMIWWRRTLTRQEVMEKYPMATEKDKAVTEARKELRRLFGVGGIGQGMLQEILNNLWDAARADAIEECARVAEKEIGATRHEIAESIRRSLSRKQEAQPK